MSQKPPIIVSSLDYDRIEALLEDGNPACDDLRAELQRAEVVESREMPAGVVSMNSVVQLEDVGSGEKMTLALVYPRDAAPGKVSILAPVGSALLGLTRGQQIDWPLPGGRSRQLRVLDVSYQPEAAGDYHR